MFRSTRRPTLEPPYDHLLKGLLSFSDLIQAEQTLHRLEDLRQRFLSAGDKKGVEYCRHLALLGRQRARAIGRNPRVGQQKRQEKQEIELWFGVWLETPDLFADWLELRKRSGGLSHILSDEQRHRIDSSNGDPS